MRLGSRDQSGPELLDDRLTWQNRAVGQLLGIAASDQRMPTGHTQVQIFHADSLRSSFLTIRAQQTSPGQRPGMCSIEPYLTSHLPHKCGVSIASDGTSLV